MRQEIESEKAKNKNKISELLLLQKIKLQFEELFQAFDADNNGYISASEVNLDNVSAQILEIFTPLFVEMESLGEQLSKADFCSAAHILYQVSRTSLNIIRFVWCADPWHDGEAGDSEF